MKTKAAFTFFILSATCLFFNGATAQPGGFLKKAKDRLENKVQQKTTVANSNTGKDGDEDFCNRLRRQLYYTTYLNFNFTDNGGTPPYCFDGYLPQRFEESVKSFDFTNLKKEVKTANSSDCSALRQELLSFETTFIRDFETRGKTQFNYVIDEAYKKSKSKVAEEREKGAEYIDSLYKQLMSVKMILPDNTEVLAMEAEIVKAGKAIKGDMAKKMSAVSTSAVHTKYAGQIMFSAKPIIPGKENEADFTTKFKPGDKIYAAAYFKAGVRDLPGGAKENQFIYANVFVDGEAVVGRGDATSSNIYVQRRLSKAEVDKNISVWTFELVADENTATSTAPWVFAEMIASLSPRKHRVELSMGEWNKGGSFEMDLEGTDMDKVIENAKNISIKAQEKIAATRTAPEEWKQYDKKAFADPALSMANMKAIIKRDFDRCAEILRIQFIAYKNEAEWEVRKNEFDIPLYKTSCNVAIIYKDKDGKCYISPSENFIRRYTGGGQYDGIRISFSEDRLNYISINCANANR